MAITEERIRQIIREEIENLSISASVDTAVVDGDYIKFMTGVCLSLGDDVISSDDGY